MASRSFIARHPILTGLLLLVVALGIAGFVIVRKNGGTWIKPDFKSSTMTVDKMTKESLSGTFTMALYNGFPMAIHADSIRYRIALEGDTIIRGFRKEDLHIKAFSNGKIAIPMQVELEKLVKKLDRLERDSARVYMKMTMFQKFPVVGLKPIPIEMNRTMYIPKFPKFEIADIDTKKLGLKGGNIVVKLKVTNYNNFPFSIDGFNYRFRMGDNIDVKSSSQERIDLKKNTTEYIEVPVKLSLDEIGEAAYKTLFKSKSTPYHLSGVFHIQTDKDFIKQIDMNYEDKGSVKELKEMAAQLAADTDKKGKGGKLLGIFGNKKDKEEKGEKDKPGLFGNKQDDDKAEKEDHKQADTKEKEQAKEQRKKEQ
jgi:LEA14-like dessication related protein